jgi:septal ring factor EnvC (AmiA/AmiB activator)
VLLLGLLPLHAQDSKKLRERREQVLREIQLTDQALRQTRDKEKNALDALLLIEQNLKLREEAAARIREEIKALNAEIIQLGHTAEAVEKQKAAALATYRQMARHRLYYRLQGMKTWVHLLAEPALGSAFMRAVLYDRLALHRKTAALRWQEEKARSVRLQTEKQEARQSLQELLDLEVAQARKADLERTERANLIRLVRQDLNALEGDLKRQQVERQKLEEAIAEMIRKEIAAAEKAKPAEKKPGSKPASPETTPAAGKLSADFARNKGKLPWPVATATISRGYGQQQHPEIRQVQINNTGVDLRTEPGASVRTVFEGVVTGVQYVPGYAYTVIVRHGDYYSVYSNMESIQVKKGDTLKTGAPVGIAATNAAQGMGEIHFELWKGKTRQNPLLWLNPNRALGNE